jgi:hypothetical protein
MEVAVPIQNMKLRNARKRRRSLVAAPFVAVGRCTDFGSYIARDVIVPSERTEEIAASEREIGELALYRAETIDELIVPQRRRSANGTPQARGPPRKD